LIDIELLDACGLASDITILGNTWCEAGEQSDFGWWAVGVQMAKTPASNRDAHTSPRELGGGI
jgi:hypothetical protein